MLAGYDIRHVPRRAVLTGFVPDEREPLLLTRTSYNKAFC